MKIKLIIFTLTVAVLLVACSNDEEIEEGSTDDIKSLVHEYSVGHIEDETASITSKELIVTSNDDTQTVYSLPADEFFVSIAPFINETHPCTDHSLTGCQGELTTEEFDVQIKDTKGNTVINDTLRTEKNGFIDLWLPRNETYSITISQNGKKVEAEFSTFDEDGTCITTMQLT